MAKNIKIGIKLPSNNQLKAEIQSAIKVMEKHATLDFKIDTKEFTKSLTSMSNELSKLKTQLSKFNVLESVQVDSSQIAKAKQEVKELGDELSKIKSDGLSSTSLTQTKDGSIVEVNKYKDSIAQTTAEVIKNGEVTKQTVTENIAQYEKLKNQLQKNLNKVIGSQYIDEDIVANLQKEINSLNTNTSVESFNKLKLAIDNVVESNKILKTQTEQRLKVEQDYDNAWQKLLKNRELQEQASYQKSLNSINKLKEQLQGKLNTASNNNLVDTSVISKLQSQLDSINTNTAEKEINELKKAINNLSSGDGGIVRVQNAITRLQGRINTIKQGNIDIIKPSEIQELKQAEGELLKLKKILNSLKTGQVIDGKAISNQINIATSSVRSLENEFKSVDKTASGLSNTMKNIFSYALGGSAFYSVMNAMRGAVDTTIELDTAMRDLKRVTDESQSTYSNFTKVANQTAKELGTTTTGAIEATTTFSQLGYSFKESSEYLSKMALTLSNVGDISASDAASSLVSILKGFRLESEETTRILDVLNEAGNRFALTTADLTEGLRIGGASLAVANNDLEESSALIISGTEILRDSNLVANGLKTISMRMRGVSTDGEELNASMGEFIKTMTDVDLTDANGEFRSTYEVLKDIGEVWDSLDSMQQASLAEEIAGKNRANVFTSIMQNAKQLEEAYNSLKDSAGSSAKEQEAYMDSLSGKINTLKESLAGLSIQMVNSDFLKGTIDTMTTGVNVIGNLIDTFGVMPTVVTGVVGSLTVFNSKFRESVDTMVSFTPKFSEWQRSLKVSQDSLLKQIESLKASKKAILDYNQSLNMAGPSLANMGKSITSLNTQLALTTAKLIATKVATIALQATLSMGLSLAITAIVSLLSSMWTGLTDVEGRIEAVNEASKNLSETLESTTNTKADLSSYEELRKKLDDITISEEERKTLSEELESVKQRLYDVDDQAYAILNNQNLSLERQLELLEKINNEKLKESAEELDKKMTGGFWGEDESRRVDRLKEIAEYSAEAYQELSKLQKEADGGTVFFKGQNIGLERQNELLEIYKKQMQEGADAVDEYNSKVKLMNDAGIETDRTTKSLSDKFKDFFNSIKESTKALDDNTRAKAENANAGGGSSPTQSIEELSKAYSEQLTKMQDVYDLTQSLNEVTAMTPDLASKIIAIYPEIGSKITSVAETQEFLNQKLIEQEDLANQAFESMVLNDNNYYENKLLQDQAWQEAFRQSLIQMGMSQEEAYNLDFKNFKNLNELKTYAMNQLGKGVSDWLSQYIDISVDGYNIDFKNFKSYAEAKEAILKALNNEIKKVTQNLATMQERANFSSNMSNLFPSGSVQGQFAKLEFDKAQAEIQKYTEQLNKLNGAILEVDSKIAGIGVGGIQLGNINFDSIKPSSGSSSSKKENEKEVADLEDLTDRYHDLEDAITDYANALSLIKLLQNNADDKEKINLMKQEIELYQKQADAVKKLNEEQKREVEELKSALSKQGVKFDATGDISNYNDILKSKTNWANSLSGDSKESAIAQVKALESALKRYDELVNNLIPKQEEEWQSLQNSISDVNDAIKDLYKDQLNMVASQEKEIASMIEYYAKKKTDAKKEAVEKELELEKKRLEGLKKSLSEEKELYNKQIDEENYEADLAKERNKLAEIQAEIDRLSLDNSARAKAQLANLLKQYDEQQKVISDKIKEHQQQATNDRFDQEMELLDKELKDTEDKFDKILEQIDKDLEEYLNPENLNNIIQNALKTGMVDLGDEVINVQSAFSDMMKETETGFINAATQIGNFIENLKEVKDLYGSINTIMTGSGLTANLPQNIGSRSVQVSVGDLIVQGNADNDVLADIQSMMDRQANEIYKNINKQLNSR